MRKLSVPEISACSAFSAVKCFLLAGLLIGAPTFGRAASLKLDVNASIQNEEGGDVNLDDRISGARRAFQVAPELTLAWGSRVLSSDLRLTPSLDVPSRRAGKPLSSLGGSWRLRVSPTWRTQLDARLRLDHLVFDRTTPWSGRTGLSAGLNGNLGLSRSLYLTGGYTFTRSDYSQDRPGPGPQDRQGSPPSFAPLPFGALAGEAPGRQDRRHGLRGGLVWFGPALYLSAGAGTRRNRSTLADYDYDGLQVDLGGGVQSGPFGLDLQASNEWRRYGQGTPSPVWRSLYLSAEATCQVTPSLSLFAGAQREYSYRDGQRASRPWMFTSAGLKIGLPLRSKPQRQRPREDVLRPYSTEKGWVFRFRRPGARNVHLIGTFSEWNPKAYALRLVPEREVWEIVIPLGPGVYEYAFLVDGQEWVAPPGALVYVDDGFGHQNGVLVIEPEEGLTAR
jgi:hypothetical protein